MLSANPQGVRILQFPILALWAAMPSIWSGIIALGSGSSWALGALSVVGWAWNIASSNLWASGFGLMAGLWVVFLGIAIMLRRMHPGQW